MIKTTNPAIKNMEHYCSGEELVDEKKVATYKGVAYKSLYYVALTLIAAFGTAILLVRLPAFSVLIAACVIAPIGALVCSLIASFAPATVPVTGSLYAIFEGAFVGAYSKLIDLVYPGVAFAALVSTFVTFGIMMALYATGVIRVGSKFRAFMFSALLCVLVCELVIAILGFFIPATTYLFYGNTWVAMIAAAIMVVLAALYILVDLSDITMMVDGHMEKKYEWNAAFGLSVTLLWLYVEILRLLAIIASMFGKKKN